MLRLSLSFVVVLGLLASGCRSSGEGGPEVVATTTHVADLTRNVAGNRVEVAGILEASSDPHDYEPAPSDATAIAEAKLVVTSGGEVDEWVEELIESSGGKAETVSLLGSAPITRTLEGDTDPHWWQDPRNAAAAVSTIRDELAATDPEGADAYERNAAAYIRRIEQTDRLVSKCIESAPKGARKLVTSHDSLGYFADRYGIEVIGSAVPALSTQAQPSTGETAGLIELLEEEDVRAVFPEAGLVGDLEQAIADEAGAEIGDALYADALGEEGTPGDTYLGTLTANATALVEGFSRGSIQCSVLGRYE